MFSNTKSSIQIIIQYLMNQAIALKKYSVSISDNLSSASTDSGDHNQISRLVPQNTKNHARNSKAKSSLCRNFAEKGYCPYGNKCQFAHGTDELKCNSDRFMSYKTRPCHSFAKKSFCLYGERCNFVHEAQQEENTENCFYQSGNLINQEYFQCSYTSE